MSTHPFTAIRGDARPESGVWINLLGGPYLLVGDERLEIPEGGKRLVAYMALHRGRIERHRVAGMLWPEKDELRAAGNLRSALWRLRSGAGYDLLVADKAELWLSTGVGTDVEVMTSWAERLILGRPLSRDLCPLTWRADQIELLPGWCDDWALTERERIRQVLLHALEALAGYLVAERRYAEAVLAAMTAIASEPLRESAHRILIEAHLAQGNLGEGRRAYETYRSLMEAELGVPPNWSGP